MMVEREEYPHTLQKKGTRGDTSKMVNKTADRMQPALTFGTSISTSTIYLIP